MDNGDLFMQDETVLKAIDLNCEEMRAFKELHAMWPKVI